MNMLNCCRATRNAGKATLCVAGREEWPTVVVRGDAMSEELPRQDKQSLKVRQQVTFARVSRLELRSRVSSMPVPTILDGPLRALKSRCAGSLVCLQMEMIIRPDGVRPHGCESLLEYFEKQLADHQSRNGTELGFHLNDDQCALLREEAVQYYYRYLSLFVLEEFPGVVRDTDAESARARPPVRQVTLTTSRICLRLEQYRPYIIMMKARAKASILQVDHKHGEALEAIEQGLADIKAFFKRFGQEESYPQCNEVRVLRQFARGIRKKLPVNPMTRLKRKLDAAVKKERYEEAAQIRDKIIQLQQSTAGYRHRPERAVGLADRYAADP